MKRSKAIELMVKFEEQAFKRFGYSLSKAEIMDGILLQLEKAGMKPPLVQFHTDNGVLDSEEFMWESEDGNEEK